MAAVQKLQRCVVSPTGKHSASVIFLHGSGTRARGCGPGREVALPDLVFDHIRVVYPTAPARPYTPMRGASSTVWFDRYRISRDSPEHLESVDAMCGALGDVVEDELKAGVPKHRVIIVVLSLWNGPTHGSLPVGRPDTRVSPCGTARHTGLSLWDGPTHGSLPVGRPDTRASPCGTARHTGLTEMDDCLTAFPDVCCAQMCAQQWGFSMGGAMALHLACRYHPEVAGVFALSSFLNKGSVAYQAAEERTRLGAGLPDLLQCHGTSDDLVLHQWGEDTAALLRKAGMSTAFHSFPGLHHQLCRPEVELLRSWVLAKLPPHGDP
ncbi:hypothetical protein NHX12_000864 [Muraenolepis orangiensis]|uniref:palmitoyl-protein hydrolase n=1 Tax=Muraenolepis orangiensis TaxID=630683 RepID=A0A9Q0DZE0_9TELE|nr:hypothetical protein NHX12_000864 [Muraenolepis orangiensis]